MNDNLPVVSVQGLTKRFGDMLAVDSLSFEVHQGEVVGLLGPSGCGKTTTLRCLAGLETPDSGLIRIGPEVVFSSERRRSVPPERRGIGMVFQSYALWPHMTVAENVAFPLRVRGKRARAAEVRERVGEALRKVRLTGLEKRLPSELSGGQQQRVAVARAIVVEPRVLVFDEPLSNLDARLRNVVRFELKELFRSLRSTTVYVTHDQQEAMALCDRIIVMDSGSVAQEGSPEDIYAKPSKRFVAEFLGDANLLTDVPSSNGPREIRDGWWVLRPEDAELLEDPVDRSIECVVQQRLYLGRHIEYALRVANSDQTIIAYSRRNFSVGATCYLLAPWTGLHKVSS